MDGSETGALADGSDPSVAGSAVEPPAIPAPEDWPFGELADNEVDGSGDPRDEWDRGGLGTLAHDAERPMTSFHAEVLDVGAAGLGYAESIQAQERGQGVVGVAEPFSGEQERAELGAVEATPFTLVKADTADVLGGVRGDAAVDVERSGRSRRPWRGAGR